MSTRPTITLDADGLTDLQIIAQRQPGKGAALQRMIDRAQMTHAAVAHAMGRARATISSWAGEIRWPGDDDVRRCLVCLGLDRKQLLDTWGVLLATDVAPRDELTSIAQRLKAELDFEFDTLERQLIIFHGLRDEILIRQGFKAREDTRAAEFFFLKGERAEEEKRLRGAEKARLVTPAQKDWAGGKVYVEPGTTQQSPSSTASIDTTTCGNSPLDGEADADSETTNEP